MSITTRARRGLATAIAGALATGGLVAMAAGPAQAAERSVNDLQFRWGLSNESNNSAYNPGTFNLFSAGVIGNPGAGSQMLSNADSGATWSNGATAGWKATAGKVTIEKKQTDGSYAPTTWAGTRVAPDGTAITPPTSKKYSDHQVVIDSGTGTLDAAAENADISWDGDFTVLYYSGMTYFTVSDPQLTVTGGTGKLTATLGGYATSMDDQTQWDALPPTEVTLADFSGLDVTEDGISGTPRYREVTYDLPTGTTGTPQERTGPTWGSFPSSFNDFQQLTGQGSYWYSSGIGGINDGKVALPFQAVRTPPSVAVSSTSVLPSGAYSVTVTGKHFTPSTAIATRAPICATGPPAPCGRSGGTYVAFGKFAESWKPSGGATSASRVASSVKWAVPAESVASVGGSAAGGIVLEADGSFTATLTVDKAVIDKAATSPTLVNYGVYTYPGGGATAPTFETYTPISFDKVASTTTLSPSSTTYGQSSSVVATVGTGAGVAVDGTVTLSGAGVNLTAPVTAGKASFVLPMLNAGATALTATYSGSANVTTSATSATAMVSRASVTIRRNKISKKPTSRKSGKTSVTLRSAAPGPITGKVTVTFKKKGQKTKTKTVTVKNGKASVTIPKLAKGTWKISVKYAGSANFAPTATTSAGTVKVTKK